MKVIQNHILVFFVFSACLFLFLWKTPFYTVDGPNHKKVAVILSRLDTSPTEAAVYKSNLSWKQTNEIFPLLYSKCFKTLPINTYEKLYFGFFACLLVLSWMLFIKTWVPKSINLWPLILPFTLHPHFFKGFFNYQASIPLALLALAALRVWVDQRKYYALLLFSLMCWLCWLAHPFPFFILSFSLLGLFLEKKENRLRLIIPSAIVFVFLYGGFIVPLQQSNSISNHWTNLLFLLCGLFLFNFHDYSIPTLLVSFPYFALLVVLTWYSLRNKNDHAKHYLSLLFLAYFTFPRSGSGGGHINERFLFFVLLFLPLGLSELRAKTVLGIRGAGLLFFIITCLMVHQGFAKIETEFTKVASLFSHLPQESRVYPVNFKTKQYSLFSDTLRHINSHYPEDKIVFSPTLFAFNDLMPLSRKKPSTTTYFPSTSEDFPGTLASSKFCVPSDFVATVDCKKKISFAIEEIFENARYYDFLFVSHPTKEFKEKLDILSGGKQLKLVSQETEYYLYQNLEAVPFEPKL